MAVPVALERRHAGLMCLPGWSYARAAAGCRRQDCGKLSLCTYPGMLRQD